MQKYAGLHVTFCAISHISALLFNHFFSVLYRVLSTLVYDCPLLILTVEIGQTVTNLLGHMMHHFLSPHNTFSCFLPSPKQRLNTQHFEPVSYYTAYTLLHLVEADTQDQLQYLSLRRHS